MKLKRVQLVTMGGMGDYFSSSAYEVGKGGCEVKSLWMSEASGMVTIVIETPTGPHCRIIAPSMVLWAIPAEMPPVGDEAGTLSEDAARVLDGEPPVKRGPGRPPKARAEVV